MEGTAQAHGATLLHCLLLLHLMQPGARAAGPGVGQGEAGQVAEALLVPWGCSLVPKSSSVPRGLGKDLSVCLEEERKKGMCEELEAGWLVRRVRGGGAVEKQTNLAREDPGNSGGNH